MASVPSFGRPVCDITCLTSGKLRKMRRISFARFTDSLSEMLKGPVARTYIAPSFSSGKNSVPKNLKEAKLITRATIATGNTILRALKQKE